MKFKDFKGKVKAHASKIAAAVSGGAVMLGGAVQAFAADGTDAEAVSDAKNLLSSDTGTLNIGNIVAIIGAGIGAAIGLFLAWWGARKLVHMLVNSFKKGKVTV